MVALVHAHRRAGVGGGDFDASRAECFDEGDGGGERAEIDGRAGPVEDDGLERPGVAHTAGSGRGDAHFREDFPDASQEPLDVLGEDAADGADAEAIGLAELAGVDDQAALTQQAVERLEVECRVVGVVERGDDVALALRWEVLTEADLTHAGDERPVVCGVTLGATGDAAFVRELPEGLVEREDDVCRRREAELAVALDAAQLGEKVQGDRPRPSYARLQRCPASDDESQSRHALEALVGGRSEVVHARGLEVKRDRRERTHRVDEVRAVRAGDDAPDLLDGVHDAGSCLAVDGGDHRDPAVTIEDIAHVGGLGRLVFRIRQALDGDSMALGDLGDALAVGAVDRGREACRPAGWQRR